MKTTIAKMLSAQINITPWKTLSTTRPLLRALRNCRICDGPWLGVAGSAAPTKLAGVRSGIGVGDRESRSVVMRVGGKVFFLWSQTYTSESFICFVSNVI